VDNFPRYTGRDEGSGILRGGGRVAGIVRNAPIMRIRVAGIGGNAPTRMRTAAGIERNAPMTRRDGLDWGRDDGEGLKPGSHSRPSRRRNEAIDYSWSLVPKRGLVRH
jgi:hypothetical protein